MTREEQKLAFNEWMRLYTEEPETFEQSFETVNRFLQEAADGAEPTYGETSAAFLQEMLDRVQTGTATA